MHRSEGSGTVDLSPLTVPLRLVDRQAGEEVMKLIGSIEGERESCLLVLNSVTSTPQWIRQPEAAWGLGTGWSKKDTTSHMYLARSGGAHKPGSMLDPGDTASLLTNHEMEILQLDIHNAGLRLTTSKSRALRLHGYYKSLFWFGGYDSHLCKSRETNGWLGVMMFP